MPRSGRAIAAMVGASRAGAVYVPLDPSSPPVRMQTIINDCGVRQVVIAPALLDNWLAASVCAPVEHFFLAADATAPAMPSSTRVHGWADVQAASAQAI